MQRNILLLKITSVLVNSYFWLGIWLFYYLLFTDYKGVGLIEMVAFANGLLMEIPTGALADLLGKRKSLILGYFIKTIGQLVMVFANSLTMLVLSVFILGPGYGLVSGTKEALLFDSLKQLKRENEYEQHLSDINKYSLIALAVASAVGGFLYSVNIRLPFLLTGVCMLFATAIAFFFKEPVMDTDTFSLKQFIAQTTKGFGSLKAGVLKSRFVVLVMLFAAFTHLVYQVFDSALAIEFGFKEQWLGIFFAVATLAAAAGNHFYVSIKNKLGLTNLYYLLLVLIGMSIVVSPIAGLYIGGLSIMLREFLQGYPNILATDAINKTTPSNIRTTTISTYYMIVGLPYAVSAYFIGYSIDLFSASTSLVFLFGIFLLSSTTVYFMYRPKK